MDVAEPPPVSDIAKDEVVCPKHLTVNTATIRIFNISSTIYGM